MWRRWEHPANHPAARIGSGRSQGAPRQLLTAAVNAWLAGAEQTLLDSVELLVGMQLCGSNAGVDLLQTDLADAVALAYTRGWQPLDLPHLVGRVLTDEHRQLVIGSLRHEHHRVAGRQVHPDWARQLAQLEISGLETPPPSLFVPAEMHDLSDQMRLMADLRGGVELLVALRQLPVLPTLIAPPGVFVAGNGPSPGSHTSRPGQPPEVPRLLDERVLAKVRGLLAKAESTTFDEEADALTAKAQELMARHAIDLALLDAGAPSTAGVSARRVHIDDPYFDAKSVLLTVVAETNQCTAVIAAAFGMVTVFGFPADIEITELLFTSLLTQATTSMVAQGRTVDGSGTSRTKSFRRSFLIAFALRVGERLRTARQAATDEAVSTVGQALVPVLALRNEQVAARQAEVFPNLKTTRSSVTNAAGWHAGREAADRASLHANPRGISRAR